MHIQMYIEKNQNHLTMNNAVYSQVQNSNNYYTQVRKAYLNFSFQVLNQFQIFDFKSMSNKN